jgi:hypothetical protein
MAHKILFHAVVCFGCSLASITPKEEFATAQEYGLWLSEQSRLIAGNLPFGLIEDLLGKDLMSKDLIDSARLHPQQP